MNLLPTIITQEKNWKNEHAGVGFEVEEAVSQRMLVTSRSCRPQMTDSKEIQVSVLLLKNLNSSSDLKE